MVGLRDPQVLHDGGLAAGGIERDHGPLQNHAVEQAEDGRDLVAIGSWARGNPSIPGRHSPDAGAVQGQDQLRRPSRQVPSSSRAVFMVVSESSR